MREAGAQHLPAFVLVGGRHHREDVREHGAHAPARVDDAREVYGAIRLANPGGLGRADAQDVAAENPDIEFDDRIVDNVSMQLVQRPEEYDVLVLPVSQVPPFSAEVEYPADINGQPQATYLDWMRAAYFITVTGCPAISVPAGFTTSGLPVGSTRPVPLLPRRRRRLIPWASRASTHRSGSSPRSSAAPGAPEEPRPAAPATAPPAPQPPDSRSVSLPRMLGRLTPICSSRGHIWVRHLLHKLTSLRGRMVR